ncbi:MAG TPA: hypothetical protein VHX38_41280 [Pseudonocardiaceae bacterium]|nr:hypothetical protein [Pseudonocardiaceae bacterium]
MFIEVGEFACDGFGVGSAGDREVVQRPGERIVANVCERSRQGACTPVGHLAGSVFGCGFSDGVTDDIGQCVVLTGCAGEINLAGPESFALGAVGLLVG